METWRRGPALVAWVLAVSCFAGAPDYDAFSEADGYIAEGRQERAAWEMMRDPEQLDAVHRDAVSGNRRATHVLQQLEATLAATGRHIAEQASRPECLVMALKEFEAHCRPNWASLDFLREERPGGARLRRAFFNAFAARARERGLENQLILSAAAGLISVEFARAALVEAEVVAGASRLSEAAKSVQKSVPANAGPVVHISPSEVAGKTPVQIDARARQLGLVPKGPDPASGRGAYVDPQTGQQRILLHPNASPPHGHVNNPAGQRIGLNGEVVPPESPAAHLPIKLP
jgi:hypothetical protein